ncbi:copper resistance protein B [Sphingomonas flavalba]|uniref:copper resistance protein B n=1 Tax=Sphingomonas flavalba TaxID=2559804 RepID=UPI0039E0A4B4
MSAALALAAALAAPQAHGDGHAVPLPPACTAEHAAMGHCTLPQAPPPPAPACTAEHAAMGHCTLPAAPAPDPHAGHALPEPAAAGTALPAGTAPPPPASAADYADRVWGGAAMAASRAALRRDHGGGRFSQLIVNLAEYQAQRGRDGYRWAAEGWFGGDINRVVVKTEGEGVFGGGVDHAEGQLLYSRAIDPYFNLQAGARQDFARGRARSYATVGVEGLAPYWFEVEAALFMSDRGALFARLGGSYDQRITQRLILQPRAELNLAAQAVPKNGVGAGLTDVALGLRLRYEVVREWAPYVGLSWHRKAGATARLARVAGEDVSATSIVFGVRAWF